MNDTIRKIAIISNFHLSEKQLHTDAEKLSTNHKIFIVGNIVPVGIEKNKTATQMWLQNDFTPWLEKINEYNENCEIVLIPSQSCPIFEDEDYLDDIFPENTIVARDCYLLDKNSNKDNNVFFMASDFKVAKMFDVEQYDESNTKVLIIPNKTEIDEEVSKSYDWVITYAGKDLGFKTKIENTNIMNLSAMQDEFEEQNYTYFYL